MTPTPLEALIARLESADGPDRELDEAIAALCDPTDDPRLAAFESGDDYPRNYTRSIDAALALVPEGRWNGEIFWNFGEQGRGFCELNLANPRWDDPDCPPDEAHRHLACVSSHIGPGEIKARPLALAICIAALRARAALTREEG